MVEPRGLGTLRIAVSLAALAALPAWGGSHSISIGATVIAPSKCRITSSGLVISPAAAPGRSSDGKLEALKCDGAAASTVSWSVNQAQAATQAADATTTRSEAASTENHAETLVLTVTP